MLYISLPTKTDLDQGKYLNLLTLMSNMAKQPESKELIDRLATAISKAHTNKTKQSIDLTKNKQEELPTTKMPESVHDLLKGDQ